MRKVYINGKILDESEAKISIYDSALMFGDMVFEMTRSFKKQHFKLKEHLERLYASINYLEIPMNIKIEKMIEIINKVVSENEHLFDENDEHRLLINVTRGVLPLYKNNISSDFFDSNVIIADFPLKWAVKGMGKLFDEGINAVIPSQRTIPASLLEPKVKNRSRLHYMMANIQASKFNGTNNWALLLDADGFISEGTGCNFFIVKNNCLITPEGRNILRGMSRQYIIEELSQSLNLEVKEKNIEIYDILNADEAFVTATPFCILPVCRINNQNINTGQMGEITCKLLNKWSENVGINIEEQIKTFNRF